jgi:hypothetical protein
VVLGQFAIGIGLMYLIEKFFKFVEEKLTDDTKLEIAVWLLGVKVGQKVEPWPETFARVFDRVFGNRHLSWKCFWRPCLATLIASVICIGLLAYLEPFAVAKPTLSVRSYYLSLPVFSVEATALPLCLVDYVSLFETRFALHLLRRWSSSASIVILLLADLIVTGATGFISYDVTWLGGTLHPFQTYTQIVVAQEEALSLWKNELRSDYQSASQGRKGTSLPNVIKEIKRLRATQEAIPRRALYMFESMWFPCFFSCLWLWLYAGSGFLLKAARRFDIGFDWFNRKFDIEKKPLSSIGLVAGALVAVIYWGAVIVSLII